MEKYYRLTDNLWRKLCKIPAPSYHEEKRAEYILNTLLSWGAKDVYIDEAKNVIFKISGELTETVVFEAHTDTVFPDLEPMPFTEDEKNVYCPGCCDDAISVAMLMTTVRYILDNGFKPKNTILIVFNACEEGLGNLKGTKAVMDKYGKDVVAFYTFDGKYENVVTRSVGSHRYKVTVKTDGGHSYSAFGNKNAAEILSRGICRIYDLKAPQDNGKTTYNVGIISGGTSVNAIVQEAQMICEYRSESYENLLYMKDKFQEIFTYMRSLGADVTVELIGERSCMKDVDGKKMHEITELCKKIQKKYAGVEVTERSGSTDCNIPHSMGIPAVCAGTYMGGGSHTREEWVEKTSIEIGFNIVKDLVLHYFGGELL